MYCAAARQGVAGRGARCARANSGVEVMRGRIFAVGPVLTGTLVFAGMAMTMIALARSLGLV